MTTEPTTGVQIVYGIDDRPPLGLNLLFPEGERTA